MKTLQGQGFSAYLQTVNNTHGIQTKVLVGPELQHSDAEQLKTKLHSVNPNAMVVKVKP